MMTLWLHGNPARPSAQLMDCLARNRRRVRRSEDTLEMIRTNMGKRGVCSELVFHSKKSLARRSLSQNIEYAAREGCEAEGGRSARFGSAHWLQSAQT